MTGVRKWFGLIPFAANLWPLGWVLNNCQFNIFPCYVYTSLPSFFFNYFLVASRWLHRAIDLVLLRCHSWAIPLPLLTLRTQLNIALLANALPAQTVDNRWCNASFLTAATWSVSVHDNLHPFSYPYPYASTNGLDNDSAVLHRFAMPEPCGGGMLY
jgi:hypothetical protein